MASEKQMGNVSDRNQRGQGGGPPWVLIGGVLAIAALAFAALYPTSGSEAGNPIADTAAASPAPSATPESPQAEPIGAHAAEDSPAAAEAQAAAAAVPKPPPNAPHPPLPFIPNGMPRPREVIAEVYEFAGANPDILEFVPCFCGCETAGHRANAHCFVQSRNPDGTVKAWEPHGMGCAVCIDVARDSMQLHASGASVRDVRSSIESEYSDRFPRMTPTPAPPQ
jgi:hypothetical protein